MLSAMYDPFVVSLYVLTRSAGIRTNDLIRLKLRDLTIGPEGVSLQGRALDLPIEFVPIFRALQITRAEAGSSDDPLFCTRYGNKMRPSGIRQRLESFSGKTALPRPRSMVVGGGLKHPSALTEFRPLKPLVSQ
jgi:site-specific recombinase XerC